MGRLDAIVTQFLRAVRPSKPNLQPGSVNDVAREALSFLKQEIQDRDILVEEEFPNSVPQILFDRAQRFDEFRVPLVVQPGVAADALPLQHIAFRVGQHGLAKSAIFDHLQGGLVLGQKTHHEGCSQQHPCLLAGDDHRLGVGFADEGCGRRESGQFRHRRRREAPGLPPIGIGHHDQGRSGWHGRRGRPDKTNFWDYAQTLFHLPKPLPVNVGLTGLGLSGAMSPAGDHFEDEVDDDCCDQREGHGRA